MMPYGLAIVSLPGMGIAHLAAWADEKGSKLATGLCGFIAVFYNNVVMAVWALFCFFFFLARTQNGHAIPMLGWGFGVTMGPLSFMNRTESKDSYGSTIAMITASVVYALSIFRHLFGISPQSELIIITVWVVLVSGLSCWIGLEKMSHISKAN
jgi:hypothetical protein